MDDGVRWWIMVDDGGWMVCDRLLPDGENPPERERHTVNYVHWQRHTETSTKLFWRKYHSALSALLDPHNRLKVTPMRMAARV